MSIETFNISLENTQNKPQYATKITCTEVKIKKSYGELKSDFLYNCLLLLFWGEGGRGGPDLKSPTTLTTSLNFKR